MSRVARALGGAGTARAGWFPALLTLTLLAAGSGCAQVKWVRVREVPSNPLADRLKLLSPSGPQPTARTLLLLRRYNLEDESKKDPVDALVKLHEINRQEPSPDKLYSLSELAYLAGKRAEPINRRRAMELHNLAMVDAYRYLFDDRFGRYRNPYDPEFRGACDLYNSALESTLRIINKTGGLAPGATHTIHVARQTVEATVVLRGAGWRAEDFDGFRFVSDYEINGLQNQHHTYGLGVPLIAIRKHHATSSEDEKFYPPGLSFPVTAFWRVVSTPENGGSHHVVHIELHDPLNTSDITVDSRPVPLESDLTTPLAYALNQKQLRSLDSSTAGLLDPAQTEKLRGLYMLEPYQPGKIPVLMIHGIWSSPITWMEMFNDLRGAPEIRSRYQFWFYLYPSGQPFWYSAAQLRKDLAEARRTIDPQHRQPALDQMVLVGHSMGGLVAELQTIDSGDNFWKIVSDEPFDRLKAPESVRNDLANVFFFRPNTSIRRVITIATPFRGSKVSNMTTRWIGNKLIKLPQMVINDRRQLHKDNPDLLRPSNLIDVATSIDALAPDSPILPVMLNSPHVGWVTYHNIIGRIPDEGLIGRIVGGSDGAVSYESAHLDNVASEVTVNADHLELTRHPLTVLEVHRILLEHLAAIDTGPRSPLEQMPWTASTANGAGGNYNPLTKPSAPEASPAAASPNFTSAPATTTPSPPGGPPPAGETANVPTDNLANPFQGAAGATGSAPLAPGSAPGGNPNAPAGAAPSQPAVIALPPSAPASSMPVLR